MHEPVSEPDQRPGAQCPRERGLSASAGKCDECADQETGKQGRADESGLREDLELEAVGIQRLFVGPPLAKVVDREVV